MKKQLLLGIALSVFVSATLFAQEKAEVSVQIKKDGKVIEDTTYVYDDVSKAKKALHMMDIIASGKQEHSSMKKHHSMVFHSDDGNVTELKGDHNVWVTSSEEDGKMEITIKKVTEEDGKKRVDVKKEVIFLGDESKDYDADWEITEGEDGEKIMTREEDGKKIKVIRKTVDSEQDGKEMKWTSDDEGEMEVIVIRKKKTGEDEMEVEVLIEDDTEITGKEKEIEEKVIMVKKKDISEKPDKEKRKQKK